MLGSAPTRARCWRTSATNSCSAPPWRGRSASSALGKLRAPDRYADVLLDEGATPLAISLQHADAAGRLRPHHRDPFDRLLIAQAQIEDAVLVTADEAFAPYDVRVAW